MSAMPFLVHSEVWGDFLPEASASSAGLLWLSTLLLLLSLLLAQGIGKTASRRSAWERGCWPSETLICGSDLAALGEWGTLTNGRLN